MMDMHDNREKYLSPSPGIASDDPLITALAADMTDGAADDRERAARLFLFVRDGVRYNPYVPYWDLDHYLAANTLERGKGYCVQKSALLATLARAAGIPARLGFGDIANHILPEGLRGYLGTNVMTFHCWAEMLINGRWVKATPSFEEELTRERGWRLVEFNGTADAMLPETDLSGRRHVEYLRVHRTSGRVPLDRIMDGWLRVYGEKRLKTWRAALAREFGET